jgi:hypothetical protein
MVHNISGFGQYNFADKSFSISDWQLNINNRYFKAFRDFKGTEDQNTPPEDASVVHSYTMDMSLSRLFKNGWSVSFSIPYAANSRTADKEHGGPGTTRHTTHTAGLGDIRLTGYKWLLKPSLSQKGNVQLGLGIKFATGEFRYQDYFYKDDTTKILAPVNASIALGDGGTGITTEINAYYVFSNTISVYGNIYYLVSPRDVSGVSTSTWRTPTPLDVQTTADVYSVPDGYSLRGGFDFSFKKLTLSPGLRDEGVPVHDLIGDSHGLRRPGHNLSFEPGVIYNLKKVSLYSYVPVIIAREIKQNPTDALASEKTGVYRMGAGGSGNYSVFVGVLFKL